MYSFTLCLKSPAQIMIKPIQPSERMMMSIDVFIVSYNWHLITGILGKNDKSVDKSLVFLSGSPLSYAITTQRGNEWDHCYTLHYFSALHYTLIIIKW